MKTAYGRLCAAARTLILLLFLPLCARAADVTVVPDIEYGVVDEHSLLGDMYVPEGQGPFPGILFIHGGGFVGGSRASGDIVAFAKFFASQGYVVFSIDYRFLNSGGMFPNNILDCKCGLGWFRGNAAAYRLDPNRIAVMGESAGAYLSAMLAFTQNEPSLQPVCPDQAAADTSVSAAALYYPPTNFVSFNAGPSQLLELVIKQQMKLKNKDEVREFKEKYSPVTYAGLAPPVFISYSDPDNTVPPSQSRELIAELESTGGVYDVYEAVGDGMDHGFVLSYPDTPQSREAVDRTVAFLEKYVKNAASDTGNGDVSAK